MTNDRYANIALLVAIVASLFLAVVDLAASNWGDFTRDVVIVLGFAALFMFFRRRAKPRVPPTS
ncbi:hypothetical protein [Rhodococcus sp. H29-C3]|uniref:hypothetical protein n=1 Tax=Rhodococcus sp. H29-C3 TaxID=3046307 RepID=UPI0024B88C36|nr:hypothetical protein [Rhodococcus sp. H29-C3]MDJ0363445.1 hypothetical protein [Rhodococcus sp. H29-C3]